MDMAALWHKIGQHLNFTLTKSSHWSFCDYSILDRISIRCYFRQHDHFGSRVTMHIICQYYQPNFFSQLNIIIWIIRLTFIWILSQCNGHRWGIFKLTPMGHSSGSWDTIYSFPLKIFPVTETYTTFYLTIVSLRPNSKYIYIYDSKYFEYEWVDFLIKVSKIYTPITQNVMENHGWHLLGKSDIKTLPNSSFNRVASMPLKRPSYEAM